VSITTTLSPVVKYHGLAHRQLLPLGLLMRPQLNGGTLGGRRRRTESMTMWHFKGELIDTDGVVATYRFFPDHVMAPTVSGVFSVDLSTFDARITQPAEAELRGLVSTDQHCVSALANKIRKAVTATGTPPKVEFFIA
jgi:hypothetical protein